MNDPFAIAWLVGYLYALGALCGRWAQVYDTDAEFPVWHLAVLAVGLGLLWPFYLGMTYAGKS